MLFILFITYWLGFGTLPPMICFFSKIYFIKNSVNMFWTKGLFKSDAPFISFHSKEVPQYISASRCLKFLELPLSSLLKLFVFLISWIIFWFLSACICIISMQKFIIIFVFLIKRLITFSLELFHCLLKGLGI